MLPLLAMIVIVYLVSILVLPFPHWSSFLVVLKEVLRTREATFLQKLSMLSYLIGDVLILPVFALFWLIDEIFFARYRNVSIREPVFIMSQPRSGTTFLLRTLSQDCDTFLSVKHLEWRYPFICLWKLVGLLGLRPWFENRSYWPNTELGRKCQKIHYHVLGVYEEFGIFLEERFYHHYFTFRRFPFPKVLAQVTDYNSLSPGARQAMIDTFVKVIKKVYYFRGHGEIFLAKENEAVDFYRVLADAFPDARFVFIVREPTKVLNSYHTMSLTCTEVKHGVNPEGITGWYDANIAFRRDQCRKFVTFYFDIRANRKTVLISFQHFTTEVLRTTQRIYRELGLPIRPEYLAILEGLQKEQKTRDPGYKNTSCGTTGFEFFAGLVSIADSHHC